MILKSIEYFFHKTFTGNYTSEFGSGWPKGKFWVKKLHDIFFKKKFHWKAYESEIAAEIEIDGGI